jgi:hypothetical protein
MANSGDLKLASLSGDWLYTNGDLTITTNSVAQNEYDILQYFPGELQQFPNLGVGIIAYQNGTINGLNTAIRRQISSDGLIVNGLNISFNTAGVLDVNLNCSRP